MKHVLLIEDDNWFAQHIKRIISGRYMVTHVTNPLDGIDRLDETVFDAIILDMMLSVSNALAFLQEVRSYDDLSQVPIIICSSIASDVPLEQLQPYGVRVLLDKTTMKPNDLLQELHTL